MSDINGNRHPFDVHTLPELVEAIGEARRIVGSNPDEKPWRLPDDAATCLDVLVRFVKVKGFEADYSWLAGCCIDASEARQVRELATKVSDVWHEWRMKSETVVSDAELDEILLLAYRGY